MDVTYFVLPGVIVIGKTVISAGSSSGFAKSRMIMSTRVVPVAPAVPVVDGQSGNTVDEQPVEVRTGENFSSLYILP